MQHARIIAITIGMVGGVLLSSVIPLPLVVIVFLLMIEVSLWTIAHVNQKNTSQHVVSTKSTTIMVLCLLGVTLGLFRVSLWNSFNHPGLLQDYVNQKVELEGVVTEEPSVGDSSTQIVVAVSLVKHITNVEQQDLGERIQVTTDRYTSVFYGDKLTLSGTVKKPGIIGDGLNTFDYGSYLAHKGIFYTVAFPKITIEKHHQAYILQEYLYRVKAVFIKQINSVFSYPASGLLAGLLISGRSSLTKADQQLFTQAGLIHIVALSGFNVTVIAQALMFAFLFVPKKLRLIIGSLAVICFVLMTGSGATVVRAGVMALLSILATLTYRTYNIGRALFVAAFLMLLWNPQTIYDVSFQLSFLATFALIFLTPLITNRYAYLFIYIPEKFKIRETIITTLVIELILFPLLLYTAGSFSLVTIITNLLILPMLPFAMAVGFGAVVVSFVFHSFALPVVAVAYGILWYILKVAEIFSQVPFAIFQIQLPIWVTILLYIILGMWFWKIRIRE